MKTVIRKNARNGWQATTNVHIPGQPEVVDGVFDTNSKFRPCNYVKVSTWKGDWGIYSDAGEFYQEKDTASMLIGNRWHRSLILPTGIRCTEKSIRAMHEQALAKLKELRPELFPPAPGDMVKRHTPAEGAPNLSFKVLEVRDGILVTEQGEVPASEYMVVRITEEQPA